MLFIVCGSKVLLGPQQLALTNEEQLLSHAGERKSKAIPKIDTQFEAPISATLAAACKNLNLVELPSAAQPAAVFVLTPRTPVIVLYTTRPPCASNWIDRYACVRWQALSRFGRCL